MDISDSKAPIQVESNYDQVRVKLQSAKLARKNAEEDAKMLRNRINMLKLEQVKASKKIQETHQKALTIVTIQQQNIGAQETKLHQKLRLQQEEKKLNSSNKTKKELTLSAIKSKKVQHEEAKHSATKEIKQELYISKEIRSVLEQQEFGRKHFKKEQIKRQEKDVVEMRKKEIV